MVVLNKIYTRTGDDGTTALGTGERRPKYDLRVEAYGTIDETNAAIGVARTHLPAEQAALDQILSNVQNDLFDLGADLSTPESDQPATVEALRILPSQVEKIEADIDLLNADLEPLRSFVLPGGSQAAAALHLARTVARRAERLVVALASHEPDRVSEAAIHYINRLSDLMFVASRWVNDKGKADVTWIPGKNR